MQLIDRHRYWLIGMVLTTLTMILFHIGIRGILGHVVSIRNIAVYLIFSLVIGLLAAGFMFYKLKVALVLFVSGWAIGFFEMFRAFINGMSGWGDLVGIISLFTWCILGLGLGLITQIGYFIYKKFKERR